MIKNALSQPGPGFDDPLAMLYACHDRVRHYARLVPRLAAHLAIRGCDAEAQQAASGILRYFNVAAPLHHQDEEDDLFPALQCCADARLAASMSRLQAEHDGLALLWSRLRVQLEDIQQGEAGLDAELAQAFARRYCEHAAAEEQEIYERARGLLNQEQLSAMGERMAQRRKTS